jgi:hypothetical protein
LVGKFIEKVYKYNIPEPSELFEIFKEKFSKAILPDSWNVSVPWTHTILGIFNEIGHDMGYFPRKEYLRLDQTWEIRLPDISSIVLALESENADSVEAILEDELQKLIDVKAFLKVLIFYPGVPVMMQKEEVEGQLQEEWSTFPEIQKRIRSAKIKNSEEKYVIITPVYVPNSSIIEVSACSFDAEGKGKDLGDFQVKYVSKD